MVCPSRSANWFTGQRSNAQSRRKGNAPQDASRKSRKHISCEIEDHIIDALQKRIDIKDKAKLKGGPYERYVLVMHTNEFHFRERTRP